MSSRLETLLSDLMVDQIENRDSFCIETDALEDLLAVVEAAQAMMRDHHAYAGREGRVCIDVPVGAFCEFASKLAHLTYSPCDEVKP